MFEKIACDDADFLLVAYVVVLLAWNFTRSKKWDEELLYVIVLIPFLLRLFRLK